MPTVTNLTNLADVITDKTHPPYSPNLASIDFRIIQKVKDTPGGSGLSSQIRETKDIIAQTLGDTRDVSRKC